MARLASTPISTSQTYGNSYKSLTYLPNLQHTSNYALLIKSLVLPLYNSLIRVKRPTSSSKHLSSCLLQVSNSINMQFLKNIRKVLNLGHTFAHAYESCLGYSKKLNHGEAVIFGIKNAVEFSYKQKFLNEKSYNLIKKHLDKIPLNKKLNNLFKTKDVNKIITFMKADKKNNSKKINLILIKDFGKIKTDSQYSEAIIKKFLYLELKK